MVGADGYLVNFHPISENFDRLFSVQIQRVADPHLPILVIAKSKKFIIGSQEQVVKLSCMHLGHRRVKIEFQQFGSLVFVKNLLVLRIFVEFSAQLKPIIFANAVHLAVLGQVERVLEPKGHFCHFYLRKGLD